ncbi:MAG TPA: hypothetical protein VJB34_08040 [Bdellovibrionota bacterium]|nr:hypothetical protein [Bdellovibrionota bacterium]
MKVLGLFFSVLLFSLQGMAQEFQVKNTLNVFEVGGRAQRVRFYLSNKAATDELLVNTRQSNLISGDPRRYNTSTQYSSLWGALASNPSSGNYLAQFSESSDQFGLVINPSLVLCAADLLRRVKEVGDKHEAIFNAKGKEIDEINIFLKPVLVVKAEPKSESDYKLQIADVQNAQTPRDPALNVQVPFNVTNSECALPSVEALETALLSAANK